MTSLTTCATILLFLCFRSTIQISRLCDRSDTSLIIDSAVAYYEKDGLKVMLFSGDVFYESDYLNDSDITDHRMNFTKNSIKQLNSALKSPIDMAFHYWSTNSLMLYNANISMGWMLDYEQGIMTERPEHKTERIDCFDLHFMTGANVCIESDTKDNLYLTFETIPNNPWYRLIKRNDNEVKVIENLIQEDNTKPFVGSLEGVPITAAFNWTQSNKEYLYMFAGRHLCRQELRSNWVPMCDIQDISDLVIDCPNKTKESNYTTPDITPEYTLYIILVIVGVVIVIIVIVILIVFVVYIRRKDIKHNELNEGSTLSYIDNKNTKYFQSSIPFSKPIESNVSLDANNSSSTTSNKNFFTKSK